MMGSWIVEALVRFNTLGLGNMERAASITNIVSLRQAELTGNLETQEGQWLRTQLAAERAITMQREAVMGVAGGISVAGAVFIGAAVDQAAKLQQVLIGIRNETGATSAQIHAITGDLYDMGNRYGLSVVQSAEIWRTVGRMTAGQMSIENMRKIAPMVEQVAATLHFNRPDISANTAAMTALRIAHLFQTYDPAKIYPLIGDAYRISGMIGEGPQNAVRQMAYFEPLFKSLGIPDSQSFGLMALLDRSGFKNKVGTNVRAMVLEALGPLQMTTHAQGAKLQMLEQIGIYNRHGQFAWNTPGGGMDFMGMLFQIGRWEHMERTRGVSAAQLDKIIYGVFGRQGGTIASLMDNPVMANFLAALEQFFKKKSTSLEAGSHAMHGGVAWQYDRAVHNFESALAALGTSLLPQATGALQTFAHWMNVISHWAFEHPYQAKNTLGFIEGGTIAGGAFTIAALAKKWVGLVRGFWRAGAAGDTAAGAAGDTAAAAAGGLGGALANLIPEVAILTLTITALNTKWKKPWEQGDMDRYAPYSPRGIYDANMRALHAAERRGLPPVPRRWSPEGALQERLHGSVVIHGDVHVTANDPLSLVEQLSALDPRSSIFESTRTHANVPLPMSVPP